VAHGHGVFWPEWPRSGCVMPAWLSNSVRGPWTYDGLLLASAIEEDMTPQLGDIWECQPPLECMSSP
jgi:hypothetical protein